MSSRGRDFVTGVLRPGGGLVVEGAGLEAAVQDADEPVGELAQRGPVAGAACALLVVVGAGSGEAFKAVKAWPSRASRSRSLCTYRARTVLRLPDLRVIGLVAA